MRYAEFIISQSIPKGSVDINLKKETVEKTEM